MNQRNALACQFNSPFRKQDVVVDERRSMRNFHENILADPREQGGIKIFRRLFQMRCRIVMEQISRDPRSLCLPVKPDPPRAVMDVVMPDHRIDCSMHLDAPDLRTCQVLFVVDMVNMAIFYEREDTTEMTDDTCLSAVVYIASSDNMRSDRFLRPSFRLCQTDTFPLRLGSVLILPVKPFVVVGFL